MRIVTTGDGSKTLFSERYQQTYHSTYGAVTESQAVFLEGSCLATRLELAGRQNRILRVLEIGFGLGLNFLLTADLALQQQVKLEYVAIEHEPVNTGLLRKLDYAQWLTHPQLVEQLHQRTEKQEMQPVSHLFRFDGEQAVPGGGISLTVHQALNRHNLAHPEGYDIVYLDAFSPDSNAECWSQEVLDSLYHAMTQDSTLATYSAKGSVRRGLESAGFVVTKRPGPPGKREVLRAQKRAKKNTQVPDKTD